MKRMLSDEYRKKVTTAERAVQVVLSGNRVWVHAGLSSPETLVEALLSRASDLKNVEVMQGLTLGKTFTNPECQGHFRTTSQFLIGDIRRAVAEGRADYLPIHNSQIEPLIASGKLPIDAALVQTAPPDDEGFMSLGICPEMSMTPALCAKHLIVEVNDQVPRTFGNCCIHVNDVEAIVESSRPLRELPPELITDVHRRIARNIEPLIRDGATLQTGIGGIPDSVLECLSHKKNLGVHTELCGEGMIPLIEAGVINNQAKTLHPGKVITSIVHGTKRMFDYVDRNPIFEFHPMRYVCDPDIIARNDNMVAINSAIQIDLTGQVCSESIGTIPYSGFGGQLDFIRGATRSKGGVPIIALPATAKDDSVSRIVPVLNLGAGVVVNRADVHYIVTEHGVADLYGKTLRQRAEALIAMAHPKFRDELYDAAVKFAYLEPRAENARNSHAVP